MFIPGGEKKRKKVKKKPQNTSISFHIVKSLNSVFLPMHFCWWKVADWQHKETCLCPFALQFQHLQ